MVILLKLNIVLMQTLSKP